MRIALSIETLQEAYDICLLVEDFTANVIASGDFDPVDVENNKKCKRFMKAYDAAFSNRPDRKKEREHWTKLLEDSWGKLNSKIKDLKNSIEK